MFHVELSQKPNLIRSFNLSAEDLRAHVLGPIEDGRSFDYGGHEWDGRAVRLTVLEGRQLGNSELILGRGWTNARKVATDVTERFVEDLRTRAAERETVGRLRERILGRLAGGPAPLGELVPLAGDLLAARAPDARVAVVAEAVWELLHLGQADLLGETGAAVPRDLWQTELLAPDHWDQATTSSIRLVRSASAANR